MWPGALIALAFLLAASAGLAQEPTPAELLELRRTIIDAERLGIPLPFLQEFPPQGFPSDLHLELFNSLSGDGPGPDPGTLGDPDGLGLAGVASAVCAIVPGSLFPDGRPAAGETRCLEPEWADLRAVAGIEDSVQVLPVRGSGFRVSGSWIATSSHLFACDQADQYYAIFGYVEEGEGTFCFGREQVYPIDCVVAHEARAASDWALVQVTVSIEGDYAELGTPRPVVPGEPCLALGHPFGLPLAGVGPAEVMQVDSYGPDGSAIRFHTGLYALDRMSGGPVLSDGAELLGLHTDSYHCNTDETLDQLVCPVECPGFQESPCEALCCSSTESAMDGMGRFVRVRNLSEEAIAVMVAGELEYVLASSSRDLRVPDRALVRLLDRPGPGARPRFRPIPRLQEALAAGSRRPQLVVQGQGGRYRARVEPGR